VFDGTCHPMFAAANDTHLFFCAEFPIRRGLYSRYTYSSWNRSTMQWIDEIGGNNNARGSGISTDCISNANGAAGIICQLRGTVGSWLYFGDAALPSVFTMCTVSRYAGNATGEILAGPNFFHGHSHGHTSVASYDNMIMTAQNSNITSKTNDWLVFCGQNAAPWHFYANGKSVGRVKSSDGIKGGNDIGINICQSKWPCNSSDFAIMEIAIWNLTLSLEEIWTVNDFYWNVLSPNKIGKDGCDVLFAKLKKV
jgi:hypothetical protein